LPKEFEQYELGCEMAFIADPKVAHEDFDRGTKHVAESGPWRFVITTLTGKTTPFNALISKDGKAVVAVYYTGYQVFQTPPPGHFLPPPDVKIDDAPKQPPPGI
jgi:subtilisin family serine protease